MQRTACAIARRAILKLHGTTILVADAEADPLLECDDRAPEARRHQPLMLTSATGRRLPAKGPTGLAGAAAGYVCSVNHVLDRVCVPDPRGGSVMVRSLENRPEAAAFRIASAPTPRGRGAPMRLCARSRRRSARCM